MVLGNVLIISFKKKCPRRKKTCSPVIQHPSQGCRSTGTLFLEVVSKSLPPSQPAQGLFFFLCPLHRQELEQSLSFHGICLGEGKKKIRAQCVLSSGSLEFRFVLAFLFLSLSLYLYKIPSPFSPLFSAFASTSIC